MNYKLVFNPISGNFEYVGISLTRSEVIGSILVESIPNNFSVSNTTLEILFDEMSVLFSDDDYNA